MGLLAYLIRRSSRSKNQRRIVQLHGSLRSITHDLNIGMPPETLDYRLEETERALTAEEKRMRKGKPIFDHGRIRKYRWKIERIREGRVDAKVATLYGLAADIQAHTAYTLGTLVGGIEVEDDEDIRQAERTGREYLVRMGLFQPSR